MLDYKRKSSGKVDEGEATASHPVDVQFYESVVPPGKIGFVGLGHMGTAMAANLAAAGLSVNAYVRRSEQLNALRPLGVSSTANASCDIAELHECARGEMQTKRRGKLHVASPKTETRP